MTAADWPLWRFRGTADRVIDGDTLVIRFDLGFGNLMAVPVRLAGIDAPEMVGESHAAGVAARDYLASVVAGRVLLVRTYRDRRSFTRYVADVFIDDGAGGLASVAGLMVEAGHAVVWWPA